MNHRKASLTAVGIVFGCVLGMGAQAVPLSATNATPGILDSESITRTVTLTPGIIQSIRVTIEFFKCGGALAGVTAPSGLGVPCESPNDGAANASEIAFRLTSPFDLLPADGSLPISLVELDTLASFPDSAPDPGTLFRFVFADTHTTSTNGLDFTTVDLTKEIELRPEQSLAPFLGKNAAGAWTLEIVDDGLTSPLGFVSFTLDLEIASVPAPATLALLGIGLLGIRVLRRRVDTR